MTAAVHQPAVVWKTLAGRIAAPGRSRVRLWSETTGKYSDTGKLSERLPERPAAVYIYAAGRTHFLAFDFDVKRGDAAAVAADAAAATRWLTECGGAVVSDRSTNGGRHLLCPLAIGTTASVREVAELLRIMARRLPTLDITPATNAATGCITVPGSACKEGGYRQLVGSVDDAVEAFTTRSAPDLLPRLAILFGALAPADQPARPQTGHQTGAELLYTVGEGEDARLRPEHLRTDPMPPSLTAYATTGNLSPAGRAPWPSHSEARMSVVTAAVARGYSAADITTNARPGGPWSALATAYDRYGHRRDEALHRDVDKARNWLITNVINHRHRQHKIKNSPGGRQGASGPADLRDWLVHALAWTDQEYAGKRYRWTVHAVFQTLAWFALNGGERVGGTWVVGVGGRSLSLGAGLLSADAIWSVLRDVRDRPGAPVLLIRRGIGPDPDRYALTTQARTPTDPHRANRVRVERIHDAWHVLGLHLRRIYELVASHGLTSVADIYAAAAVPRSTGDAMVADLQIAGLITRTTRGHVAPGRRTLDEIAEHAGLATVRENLEAHYRTERAQWRGWLAGRDHHPAPPELLDRPDPTPAAGEDAADTLSWLESVMATGPPARDDIDTEHDAIELLTEILGARLVPA